MIPSDHICHLASSIVDSMDFSMFDKKYAGAGHPAYHPRIILKLLLMGILDKVRSSRKIAKNARENVVYMFLAEKVSPDFRTISDFRKNNLDMIKEMFRHTVHLAKAHGLLDLSVLSTDGTKIKANASNNKILTTDELRLLKDFVDNELEEWARQDNIEDEQYGNFRGSDQLPGKDKKKIEKIVKEYVEKMRKNGHACFKKEVKEKLEKMQEQADSFNLQKVSMVDPESRFMKNKKKRIELSYNPQITVDKKGFVISNDVSQDCADTSQLEAQILETRKNIGELPKTTKWNFDNGYFSTANLEFAKRENIDAHIQMQKISASEYSTDKFKYVPDKNVYLCPEGKTLKFLSKRYDKTRDNDCLIYKSYDCAGCPNQNLCTKNKSGLRFIKITENPELRDEMRAKMNSDIGKNTYKLRKQTVEPAFGDIKSNKGLTEFLVRGLCNVKAEMNLACSAANVRKMWIEKQVSGGLRGVNSIQRTILQIFSAELQVQN